MTCTNKKYIFLLTTTLTISVTYLPKNKIKEKRVTDNYPNTQGLKKL